MSKQFVLLKSARKLEKYLSREYYNLTKMENNDRVPFSLLDTKVNNFNELVDALNDLFSGLSEIQGDDEELFERYVISSYDDEIDDYSDYVHDEEPPETPMEKEAWELEGFNSENAWRLSKEKECVELPDDTSISLDVNLSKQRANQVLEDYEQATTGDIAKYVPEDDKPVEVFNVIPTNDIQVEDDIVNEEPENIGVRDDSGLDYVSRTVDNIRVDGDPIQIAGVTTAVELDDDSVKKGLDIDIDAYTYKAENMIVNNLIDDDIEKLMVNSNNNMED